MPLFLICIHDVTPACESETRAMIRDLAPLVGRSLSFGVVPDWHGTWPLSLHPEFCRLIEDSGGERLLHGYTHRRQRGRGPATWLTGGSDEMNGLTAEETQRVIAHGQRDFVRVFGEPARGFLAPAWQLGHVGPTSANMAGLEHVLGFFSLRSSTGKRVALATFTWDCGRWGWLGHVGHAAGGVLHSMRGRIPVLAIHPNDLQRGFWPAILQLTNDLIERGYQPTTPAALLEAAC